MADRNIVLVTGANQGLGFAIVQAAAARLPRAHYILACRDTAAGEQAVKQLGQDGMSLEVLKLDVTKDTDIETAVQSVTSQHGRLDILINNAGIARWPKDESLQNLRAIYTEMLSVNLTSVACMCAAFKSLLHKSAGPKVINITSGLGSINNALTRKMVRAPAYGASKVGLNGLTVHLQTEENDRTAKHNGEVEMISSPAQIRYYAVAPGVLKTAFTGFRVGKDPIEGAEVVLQLMLSDKYPGGSQWEYEDGEMREVAW